MAHTHEHTHRRTGKFTGVDANVVFINLYSLNIYFRHNMRSQEDRKARLHFAASYGNGLRLHLHSLRNIFITSVFYVDDLCAV